nr:hypothetical protein [Tanacetum cinerariifolium]
MNEDDALNFLILVHGMQYDIKEKGKETTIISLRTRSSQDNVSRYLNETPTPSLEDVVLPRITTSGLNYNDGSSRKKKPSGNSVDPDRLPKSQTVILPEITTTKPTRLDQRGSTWVDYMLITTDETLILAVQPITSVFDPIPSHSITTKPTTSKQKKHVCDINNDLYIALSKSVEQDKQVSPTDSCRDANLKKRSHDDQNKPEKHKGEKRYKKQKFVSQSSLRNDKVMLKASDHERQPSFAGKIPEHPRWFDGYPTEYTDYLWVRSSSAKDRKDRYELFGNRFMSKSEYDYNMDQTIITVSDDMDWARDYRLGLDGKEPLSLVGPKLSQRIPLEHFFNEDLDKIPNGIPLSCVILGVLHKYKYGWIEEDIGSPFRRTLVDYDIDVILRTHHWEELKKLSYRGIRSATTVEKVYLDLKITFVDAVTVDVLFEYNFLASITVTIADKKKYTFKESYFSQLILNGIEDMYVLKAHGKLKHLGVTETFLYF